MQNNEADLVNNPPHYQQGGIQAIDIIRAKLSGEEFKGYLRGNVLKYVIRAPLKGNENQDYEKAMFYLKELGK